MDSYIRRTFAGTAPDTTLAADIDATTLTFTLTDSTGWGTGSADNPFEVTFEPDEDNEEKNWGYRSGSTVTLLARGMEGTAVSHTAGTVVRHGLSALDMDEANYAVSQTVGKVSAKGSIIVASAANTFGELEIGTTGQALIVASGTLAYGKPTLAESDITDLVTDLAGKLDTPDTDFALGSIVVGTGANTYDTLAVGAAGGILVAQADGSLAYLPLGVDGTVLSASGGALVYAAPASSILGSTAYAPSVTFPSSEAALDTTNLKLTFTAPASGKVLIRAALELTNSSGTPTWNASLGWFAHGTTTSVGVRQKLIDFNGTGGSSVGGGNFTQEQLITGLTAGQSYTYDLTGVKATATVNGSNFVLTAWAA